MAWLNVCHDTPEALAQACADALQAAATEAVKARGQAQFALAGGRTPLPALRRWAAQASIDARIAITLTDERWVPADHPACNLSRLQACFSAGTGPRWRPLVPAQPGTEPDLATARDSLGLLAAPWDLVLLGMGEDGHIASLFPNDPNLAGAMDPANLSDAVVARPRPLPPEVPYPRISQTLARLLRSRRRLLLVTGDSKRALIERAQAAPDPLRWPVSALLHAPGPAVEIHWSP